MTHPWRRPWLDCCGARNQDSGRASLPQILGLTARSRGGAPQEPNQVPGPVGATNADTGTRQRHGNSTEHRRSLHPRLVTRRPSRGQPEHHQPGACGALQNPQNEQGGQNREGMTKAGRRRLARNGPKGTRNSNLVVLIFPNSNPPEDYLEAMVRRQNKGETS